MYLNFRYIHFAIIHIIDIEHFGLSEQPNKARLSENLKVLESLTISDTLKD